MAVPKKKTSKSRTGRRKAANMKIKVDSLTLCTKCKESVLPHTVCKNCGTYKGKQIIG